MSRDPDSPTATGGRASSSPRLRPAVFLDRDGTLIREADYLADPDGVELVPGGAAAIRALRKAGLAVVVVTNQSGIARGLYGLDDYRAVARRLDEVLEEASASVDATFFCPHHPDFTGPCDCRKPATGMHRRAARELELDLSGSYFVGDKPSDVLPARKLGGHGLLVRTGFGRRSESEVPDGVEVVDDLPAAARRILDEAAARRSGRRPG